MRPTRSIRLLPLAALAAALAMPAGPAQAQNFLERLFGIKPERPPVPQLRPSDGGPVPGPGQSEDAVPGQPAPEMRPPPVPRGPVVLKAPAEDSVIGQDLQRNGMGGSLRLERAAGGVAATITLPGTKISQPTESCTVKLGGGKPVPFTSAGRPEGVPRYEAPTAECPLRLDVTEGAVLATTLEGGATCTFTAADCATTPVGMWGPAPASLTPRAGEFDTARGVADKAVRDNYKLMTQRARSEDVRPIVAEQAAFSADREQFCRAYAREGVHGFCHLRYTENRALALATRLGANTAAPTAATAVAPRRAPRPRPAVEGLNPDAGAGFGADPE
ncbi:hypothetical protein [Methylobacterium aerolatum]|uniref:Lysozyme inhibitor LprI N-terminal domain-containing protein n=1 Tax=Methylobacterium aerolatum TaxID=418708 RepID=A0ABU0HWE9_9HYPH|nr:hypothetical protein [Methylobacterium aerolatum]MDQ0446143.1 hypothetical protein [Methylobacterium aerolatum]GJD35485.1 hypothetical protein FMGBMHLM_2395 [Methylobacterium aerolatum]